MPYQPRMHPADHPIPSRTLPPEWENELKSGHEETGRILDVTDDPNYKVGPIVIGTNTMSGCQGRYSVKRGFAVFEWFHGKQCRCRYPDVEMENIPGPLMHHFQRLVHGQLKGVPKMESNFAAIVIVKEFLNMGSVPELLRVNWEYYNSLERRMKVLESESKTNKHRKDIQI